MSDQPQLGAGVIIVKDGRTLLAKRKNAHGKGSYGSLGGHVKYGESPVEVVKREADGTPLINYQGPFLNLFVPHSKHIAKAPHFMTSMNGTHE